MAVDLGDLIDSLKREVNPPGSNAFPNATDDDYFGYLQDAYWEARLDGITALAAWNEDDNGVLTAVSVGGTDISRDLQQLVVLYAGIRIIRNQILNTNTAFRASAGPASYETEKSAAVLKAVLDELRARRDVVYERLSDFLTSKTYYIDGVIERDASVNYGDTFFPSSGAPGLRGTWS